MCFWKTKQQEEESKGITRDKIDDILDLIVGLTPAQFNNLKAGMDAFYKGYSTIKGIKTPEEREQEKDAKEMKKIDDLDKQLEYEQVKAKVKGKKK